MSVGINLRLRESVGIVTGKDRVDFFKANTRDTISLKMKFHDIVNLLKLFDGKTSIEKVSETYGLVDKKQLTDLAIYLKENFILIEQDSIYPVEIIKGNLRLINFLEDYFNTTSGVLSAIERLNNSNVMIVGLGAVGSYLATYLAKSNVGNFVLVDNDKVDLSNLHRQYYFEKSVGSKKSEVLKKDLEDINKDVKIKIISKFLENDFFEKTEIPKNIDLIINCSDEPSVDATSRVISKYAMKNKIPHIVGGGYNLHLTLIGQTIIPFQSACFNCFNMALKDVNSKDLRNVRILHRENRKLGSFSPLSGISASLAALDAFKVLIKKYDTLQQSNKRIEFNVQDLKFKIINIERNLNCNWCGEFDSE